MKWQILIGMLFWHTNMQASTLDLYGKYTLDKEKVDTKAECVDKKGWIYADTGLARNCYWVLKSADLVCYPTWDGYEGGIEEANFSMSRLVVGITEQRSFGYPFPPRSAPTYSLTIHFHDTYRIVLPEERPTIYLKSLTCKADNTAKITAEEVKQVLEAGGIIKD